MRCASSIGSDTRSGLHARCAADITLDRILREVVRLALQTILLPVDKGGVVVRSSEEIASLRAAYEQELAHLAAEARNRERGDLGEALIRRMLDALVPEGWRVLHKRHWPGTRRADLDHVLIGPGGVLVLDTKNWRGHVKLSGGRLLHGQDDATGELDDVAEQVAAVQAALEPLFLAPAQVVGAMVLVNQNVPAGVAGGTHVLAACDLIRWIRALGRKLDQQSVASLASAVEIAVPPHNAPARPPVVVTRPLARRRPEVQPALFDIASVDLDELERATKLGVEDWMTYLHPSQLEVVRRRASGPSRLRGPAGCGKTVVALHRAAYLLSREPGDLVFLTYVRTLPAVFGALYARLSPHTSNRAQFTGLHSFAFSALREAGVRVRIDAATAETCINRAWANVGRDRLEGTGLPREYWNEEIQHVIKGRGLEDFSEYAELARTGRRTRLGTDQRAAVWDMFVRYQELMDAKGAHDFADVINLALRASERGAVPKCRFVMVDEAQDLSLQAVRLAASLVSEDRDGLTLVGDGQQAVYPGGYTLREAGISVSGRSTVLSVNYRNTVEVLEAAQRLVAADEFDDLEALGELGSREVQVLRHGAAVCDVKAQDPASADIALVERLRNDAPLGHRGSAVLCRTRSEESRVLALLDRHGISAMSLEEYGGLPDDRVKVGTAKRAKGLEFPRVYLPRTDTYLIADGCAETERVQRERRELFVAMTRARDGLWCCRVDEVG